MGSIPSSLLRQPPPPPPRRHRRLLMASDKEGSTEMAVGSCVPGKGRTRPYYNRRCKRKVLTNIECLSDDLVFEILLRVPAQDIYDLARLVCRKWYHMIHTHNFICAHLQHTTFGLFFQNLGGPRYTFFVALQQGRIEKSKFSYHFSCPIRVSCNGLILGFQCIKRGTLYIANPTTKQNFILPPFFCEIQIKNLCGLGYVASSMEYKVVVTYDPHVSGVYQCAILTVGVDLSWRNVRTEQLSPTAKKVFNSSPLITEGFMHWTTGGIQVLTLNVETEIITETPAPIPQVYGGQNKKYYLSTGRYLSLLITRGEFLWEVWEMKPETGEWRKLPNIALEAQKCTFEQFICEHDQYLMPVGWLTYPKVLVFGISDDGHAFIFYNLLTQEIDLIESSPICKSYNIILHKNTLVWLGGC